MRNILNYLRVLLSKIYKYTSTLVNFCALYSIDVPNNDEHTNSLTTK